LIPIDFAESSVRAIRYAEGVFSGHEAELQLIYVAPREKSKDQITKEFAEFESKHLKPSRIPYTFSINTGSLLEELQKAIHRIKPTVVMIGLEDGSLSKAFLKLTDCPVILVPRDNSKVKIKNIAYANDFKDIRDSSAFKPLLELSRAFGANIHIIHVNKGDTLTQDKGEAAIEYYLDAVNHEYISLNGNDIVDAIQKYLADKKIDLLTLLLRDHGSNELQTKGKLVEQLVNKSNVPLLSLL
jgi:nucleotide-binding universal stress UspA family protein